MEGFKKKGKRKAEPLEHNVSKRDKGSDGGLSDDSDDVVETSAHLRIAKHRCLPFKEALAKAPLIHDDLGKTDELYLIQLPPNLDPRDLDGLTLSTTSTNEINGRSFNVTQLASNGAHPFECSFPVLPSRKRSKLKLSNIFNGQIELCETLALPSVSMPKDLEPPAIKQLEEINHVFKPFGLGKTQVSTSKGQSDKSKKSVPSKKKKKEKKPKKSRK